MNEIKSTLPYRLSRAVAWNFLSGSEALQIRFPNGDHLTVNDDAQAVNSILCDLASGRQPFGDEELITEVLELLLQRKVLVSGPNAGNDWLEDMFEYVLANANRQSTPTALIDQARQYRFSIAGSGWLAHMATEACARAGLTLVDEVTHRDHCIIAVADKISFDRFSSLNAEACAREMPIIFFWREVARIVCGPLVLPGESACFECYRTRVRANVRFGAEFEALAGNEVDRRDALGSRLAEGAAQSFIARQLLAVATKAYDLVEPNTLYSYDALTLALDRQAIMRSPRCPACSVRRIEPINAVRAIA